MIEDEILERTRAWQHDPVTIRLKQVLQAKLIETQQQYAAANSIDQYRYLSGKEIGYQMAIDAVENLHEPFRVDFVQVPVITIEEKKK
jgi:hypothetical protein